VVSNASYAPGPIAAQEIVSLFGPGLASQTAIAPSLTTALGGTSVQFTDSAGKTQLAELFAVTPGQANVLVPSGLAAGAAKIAVLSGSTPTLTASAAIANSAPALYSANSDGAGVAAAEASQAVYTCAQGTPRSCLGVPLRVSASTLYVELYGTGIRNAASVQCFVGGVSVPVLYAGPAPGYSGLDQVNISLPATLAGSGDVRVYLVADGTNSNVVGLTIQ
jgi:uncharacterized protein (TIGR03437 family)